VGNISSFLAMANILMIIGVGGIMIVIIMIVRVVNEGTSFVYFASMIKHITLIYDIHCTSSLPCPFVPTIGADHPLVGKHTEAEHIVHLSQSYQVCTWEGWIMAFIPLLF
jgi:hypothetical protein